jgi:hypothetical protein
LKPQVEIGTGPFYPSLHFRDCRRWQLRGRRWGKSNGRLDESCADPADILVGIAVLETPWLIKSLMSHTQGERIGNDQQSKLIQRNLKGDLRTTGIDLALALIEEDAGRQVAMNVARMLVVYLKRAGGQSQYSALLAAQIQSESETFDSLDRWIAEHLNDDLRVGALAEQVHMSPRTSRGPMQKSGAVLQQRPWRRYGWKQQGDVSKRPKTGSSPSPRTPGSATRSRCGARSSGF